MSARHRPATVATGTVSAAAVDAAVSRLAHAASIYRPGPPVRDLLPPGDIDAAYAVQSALIDARVAAGARRMGHKIGLTSPAVQAQLGVDQPDFGVLLDDMICSQDVPIRYSRLLQPRIEAEIAFLMGDSLDGPGMLSRDRVHDAVAYALPALEIVDSRVADWDITIVDTIADNASSGLVVLGEQSLPVESFEPSAVTMVLYRGSSIVSSGSGADCLGDPLTALVWLAEIAHRHGRPLRAGDIILSGALGPMVPVKPGDAFTAQLTGLGTVRAEFTLQDAEETP